MGTNGCGWGDADANFCVVRKCSSLLRGRGGGGEGRREGAGLGGRRERGGGGGVVGGGLLLELCSWLFVFLFVVDSCVGLLCGMLHGL